MNYAELVREAARTHRLLADARSQHDEIKAEHNAIADRLTALAAELDGGVIVPRGELDALITRLIDLRVEVVEDGEGLFFAQGMGIDYAAGGTSADEAMENFSTGLYGTILIQLERFGSCKALLDD